MINKFNFIRKYFKPFFSWIPPYLIEWMVYPFVTWFTMPLKTNKPICLVLELSNICNLKCKICTRPPDGAPIGHMDILLAKELLKQAYDCGISSIGFHTIGEPLLYPHLKEVLAFAKNLGFSIQVTTNANLLTKENSDMLLNIGIERIRVSLDGTGEVYNSIRRGGDFNHTIKNIEYLFNKRSVNSLPKIGLNYVVTKETVGCISEFKKNYGKLFDEIRFMPLFNLGSVENDYVKKESIVSFKNDKYPCFKLWANMHILFNGDVSVCCVDYDHKLIIGNVNNRTLLDLWNSSAYMNYRKLNREGGINKIKFCNNCTLPVLGSTFYMKKIAKVIRKKYELDIKILNRY